MSIKNDHKAIAKLEKSAYGIIIYESTDATLKTYYSWNKKSEKTEVKTDKIANFTLFYQYSLSYKGTYINYFELRYFAGLHQILLKGNHLSDANDFRKSIAKQAPAAVFEGSNRDLFFWVTEYLIKDEVKLVDNIDFIGYVSKYNIFLLSDLGINLTTNETIILNSFKLIDFGHIAMKPSLIENNYKKDFSWNTENECFDFLPLFFEAFGSKGLITLAFFTASLFCNQFRQKFKFFPFLELSGKPATGKTTLINWIWQLFGRVDYEGIPILKTNPRAVDRVFAQLSGFPMILVEGDKGQGYDFDVLKPLYNGGALRVRAERDEGLNTYEPEFNASIVISQNKTVETSKAVMERIIKLDFDMPVSDESEKAYIELINKYSFEDLSSFAYNILTTFDFFGFLDDSYKNEVVELPHKRIRNNYTFINAAVKSVEKYFLSKFHGKKGGLEIYNRDYAPCFRKYGVEIIKLSRTRLQEIALEPTEIRMMWELFEHYKEEINHYKGDNDCIALSFVHFNEVLGYKKQKLLDISKIKNVLNESKTYKFIEYKTSWSVLLDKSVKCYIFKK